MDSYRIASAAPWAFATADWDRSHELLWRPPAPARARALHVRLDVHLIHSAAPRLGRPDHGDFFLVQIGVFIVATTPAIILS